MTDKKAKKTKPKKKAAAKPKKGRKPKKTKARDPAVDIETAAAPTQIPVTSSGKTVVEFKHCNTRWACAVHTQDGAVVGAATLCNMNTGQPWTVAMFCERYGVIEKEFLRWLLFNSA